MNTLRNLLLVGLGVVLATLLVWGASATFAQGSGEDGHAWMMGGEAGTMQCEMDHEAMRDGSCLMEGEMDHEAMRGGMGMMRGEMDHEAMHAAMHDGEAMPEDCPAMTGEAGMRDRMMQHMHHGMPETPAE